MDGQFKDVVHLNICLITFPYSTNQTLLSFLRTLKKDISKSFRQNFKINFKIYISIGNYTLLDSSPVIKQYYIQNLGKFWEKLLLKENFISKHFIQLHKEGTK